MARRLLIALGAVLVTGTLLWGECVACRDMLSAAKATRGCCESSGKCKNPGTAPDHKHCKSPSLATQQYVVVELAKVSPDLTPVVQAAPAASMERAAPAPHLGPPGYSPPELYLLHSVLLI